MQRLRTVTLLDVSAVAGHHAMPAALLFGVVSIAQLLEVTDSAVLGGVAEIVSSNPTVGRS